MRANGVKTMIKTAFYNFSLPEGKIEVDSDFGKEIGFTTEAGFDKDCYLWGYPHENGLMLSLIICKKKGGFKNLIQNIEKRKLFFRIPTPSGRMIEIGNKQGWVLGTDGTCEFLTNEKRQC